MLLPKSQSELARWFSIAALVLLAICYLGVLLAPNLSIHLATDTQEPQLAGDWRGSFGHKNVAAAMMAMLLFIGIYIARVRRVAVRDRDHRACRRCFCSRPTARARPRCSSRCWC